MKYRRNRDLIWNKLNSICRIITIVLLVICGILFLVLR
jgi:hypothetical protein